MSIRKIKNVLNNCFLYYHMKMRNFSIFILLIIAVLFSLRIGKLSNLTNFDVNIRDSPSINGNIIGKIQKDDEVKVLKSYNSWVAIYLDNKTAYTYRESLNCTALKLFPLKFNISSNLSYKYTPEIFFRDNYKISKYEIPTYVISLLSLFLALFLAFYKQKSRVIKVKNKVQNTKIEPEYPELNLYEARTQIYKFKPKVTDFKVAPDISSRKNESKTADTYYKKDSYANKKSKKDWMTPQEKGAAFENYIVKKISLKYFKFLDWASDKITECGIYAESNKNPDLKFKHLKSGVEFFIECKYRSSDNIVIEDFQLTRYKKFGAINKVNVFVAIGTEGTPDSPNNLYLIPTYVIKNSNSINSIKEKYRKRNLNKMFYFDSKFRTLR